MKKRPGWVDLPGALVFLLDFLSWHYNRIRPIEERREGAFLRLPPRSSLVQAVYCCLRSLGVTKVMKCGFVVLDIVLDAVAGGIGGRLGP
jgi:hypothetical protein